MILSLTAQKISRSYTLMLPGSVLATNVIFTSLVVGRLVYYQRHLKDTLGISF